MDKELVLQNLDLVKKIAGKMTSYYRGVMDYDDIYQYGVLGLIDASDKYSKDKNTDFKSYAGIRIKGAIIDGIRKESWVTRHYATIESEKNKPFMSIEHMVEEGNKEIVQLSITIDNIVESKEIKDKIIKTMNELSKRDKKMLMLHYFKGVKLKEIAKNIGISPTRASQINKDFINKFKQELHEEET